MVKEKRKSSKETRKPKQPKAAPAAGPSPFLTPPGKK